LAAAGVPEAEICLKEVVIDGGPEFKGEFRKACTCLKICAPDPAALAGPQRFAYSLDAEQIDGTVTFDTDDYIVEATLHEGAC
jgi:hypothetical protein